MYTMRAVRLLAGVLGLLAGTSRAADSVPKESGAPEPGEATGEATEERGFRGYLGVLVGPNFASVSAADGTQDPGTKTQMTGGVFFEGRILRNLALQPEIRYANISPGDGSVDCLAVPLLVKGVLPTGSVLDLHAQLGPEIYVNIGSSTITKPNSLMLALSFGGGLDFKVAQRVALFTDFRYVLGLTNVLEGLDDKARELQILFGGKFELWN